MHNIGKDIHHGIMQKSLIPYFIEWCETDKTSVRGVACRDTAFVLNTEGPDFTTTVEKSPDANIYTYVDLPLLDPVEDTVSRKVMQFLSQTLWRNKYALTITLYCSALALAGMNITRAVWSYGPGGVGQSLLSHLIANMFGKLHQFIDTGI